MKKILLILFIASFGVQAADYNSWNNKQQIEKDLQLLQEFQQKHQSKLGAGVVTVGFDNQCDFIDGATRIQDAIDSGATEIRLASNGSYQEKLSIDNRSISIRGGFANCLAAQNNQQTNVFADLNSSNATSLPGIKITGSAGNNQIYLERLNIHGNQSNYQAGGIDVSSQVDLILNYVNIYSNTGGTAGGIQMFADGGSLSLYDTYVFNNTGGKGGGLRCKGDGLSVNVYQNSGLSFNQATSGGGAYIGEGCTFNMYSGSDQFMSLSGIAYNEALKKGGGLYVGSNATINVNGNKVCVSVNNCIGNSRNPVNINNNVANAENNPTGENVGGGIYLTNALYNGVVTSATLSGVMFKENISGGSGGAIYASGTNVDLTIKQDSKDCWNKGKCNLFSGNRTATAGAANLPNGGAIYASQVNTGISHAFFEYNRAFSGTAIYLVGGTTTVESSIFSRNGFFGDGGYDDNNVIYLSLDADLSIIHSTFAENFTLDSTIDGFSATRLNVASTIIYDILPTNTLSNISANSVSYNCLLVSKLPVQSGVNIIVGYPNFIDPANQDYHIGNDSIAIDMCSYNFSQSKDMDGENFGWNDPSVPNQGGLTLNTYDAGADESYANDQVFINSFESL